MAIVFFADLPCGNSDIYVALKIAASILHKRLQAVKTRHLGVCESFILIPNPLSFSLGMRSLLFQSDCGFSVRCSDTMYLSITQTAVSVK